MRHLKYFILSLLIMAVTACDKKNDNVVQPITGDAFPQIISLADEGDGELEDEDKFSFVLTLADRVDPDGGELEGRIVPLKQSVRVNFEVTDLKGFNNLSDYVRGAKAFYEIDDCITSEDMGIDLKLTYDTNTGKGSVDFPAGAEEIEIELETNPDLFDDDVFNPTGRTLNIRLTSVNASDGNVAVNTSNLFRYTVLDDEAIYGEYELNTSDPVQLQKFISLFGAINEDVKVLKAADVDEIKIAFEYGEFKAIVVLKETEQTDDCGTIETVNKEIEIEGGIEKLDAVKLEGDVEFAGDIEQEDGSEREFAYEGSFKIAGGRLELTLQGEYNDTETEKVTFILNK